MSGRLEQCGADDRVTMYVCGITPYDATHVGHAMTYVTFDLIQRFWLDQGKDVHYVQNLTDIDDPLLERAYTSGEDWRELAERETELFRNDMQALRVIPPKWYVGAVESIPVITATISQLQTHGVTYRVDHDIYFDTTTDPRFGEVCGLSMADMRRLDRERGGDPGRAGKRNALDPVLWRSGAKDPAWPSDAGPGRPGWHIECSAIASEYLGAPIDVQGGGADLAFPHHEMCASLTRTSEDVETFARCYVHTGMVRFHGEKMSKSLGNLVFVKDLLAAGADPMAVRLALLSRHYRDSWEWSPAILRDAGERLLRWREAFAGDSGAASQPVVDEIRRAIADDLDTPSALRAVDCWVDRRSGKPEEPTRLAAAVDLLLGVR